MDEDTFIGITKEGIIETNIDKWFEIYHKNVEKKLENLRMNRKNLSIEKSSMYGILSINLEKYGYIYNKIKFEISHKIDGIEWYKIIKSYVPSVNTSVDETQNNQSIISES